MKRIELHHKGIVIEQFDDESGFNPLQAGQRLTIHCGVSFTSTGYRILRTYEDDELIAAELEEV